jgi:hypothetical protein
MKSPNGEPHHQIEHIQAKLAKLAEILSDISSQMKRVAELRRGGLRALEHATDRPDLDWMPPIAGAAGRHPEPPETPPPIRFETNPGKPRIRYAQYVEFSTLDEVLKFKHLPAIRRQDVANIDWDELERKLAG